MRGMFGKPLIPDMVPNPLFLSKHDQRLRDGKAAGARERNETALCEGLPVTGALLVEAILRGLSRCPTLVKLKSSEAADQPSGCWGIGSRSMDIVSLDAKQVLRPPAQKTPCLRFEARSGVQPSPADRWCSETVAARQVR